MGVHEVAVRLAVAVAAVRRPLHNRSLLGVGAAGGPYRSPNPRWCRLASISTVRTSLTEINGW